MIWQHLISRWAARLWAARVLGRAIALAGGLAGGLSLSQFPEFSQQYLQRLGGAVDALAVVVADFDASAKAEGLTREAALEQMTGTAFLDRRRTDMERTFARFDRLTADRQALLGMTAMERALNVNRMADPEVARAVWQDFEPAVPASTTGAAFAGAGFFGGWLSLGALMGLIGRLFGRRRRAA